MLSQLGGPHLAQFEWVPPAGDRISFLLYNSLWIAPLDGSGARALLA